MAKRMVPLKAKTKDHRMVTFMVSLKERTKDQSMPISMTTLKARTKEDRCMALSKTRTKLNTHLHLVS